MKTKMLECYRAYKDGKMSINTCCNRIIELVFKNPNYFQIGRLQTDLKSHLIILLYDSLDSILKKYNEQYGSFVTYLAATIKGLKTRCFRDFYRQSATEMTVCDYYRNCYLEEDDPVFKNSYIASISPIDYISKKIIPRPYIVPSKKIQKEVSYTHLCSSQKLLIIALKSAYFLDNTIIQKMAPYTKLSTIELEKICLNLKKSLESRRIKYDSKMQMINHEFLLKNRCLQELKYQSKDTYTYQNRLKAYKFHTKRWKIMLANKPKPRYLCPKNREIADILHISEDQVHYILHKYGKNPDSQKLLKIVLSEHDNLFSDREPPQKD
jgi:hypothetical protein